MDREEHPSVLGDLSSLRDDLCFWLRRWYRSPLAYVIEMVGDVPTHQQASILRAFERHRFVAVASGHGIGKSRLMGWLVNWWLDTRGKIAPITGAGGDQLTVTTWKEISGVASSKWPFLSSRYTCLTEKMFSKEDPSHCMAVLRTARADNNDALQGFHDCMFFIDEGSGVRDEIFEVAAGAMGDPGNFGFMAGNPTKTSGYMYNVFHSKSFWFCLKFSSEDTIAEEEYEYPYIDPHGELRMIRVNGRQTREWIANMRDTYGLNSNVYRYRVLGEFAQKSADYLVPEQWLDSVWEKRGEGDVRYMRRMGVDPAWMGDDDTGVVIREGDRILHAESWHGFDLVESFNRVRLLFHEWKCDWVHVDAIGVGAGLYDMLNHAVFRDRVGYPVVKVLASASAPDDSEAPCKTLRDWLWWRCRQFFRGRRPCFMGDESMDGFVQLRREICEPTYKIVNGKVVAESKDDLKRRGLKSPNLADALNLTFFGDSETFQVKRMTTRLLKGFGGKGVPDLNWKVL